MARLIKKIQPIEQKYEIELTQREIGLIFNALEKSGGYNNLEDIKRYNEEHGNYYDTLADYQTSDSLERYNALHDLFNSLAVFNDASSIKNNKTMVVNK